MSLRCQYLPESLPYQMAQAIWYFLQTNLKCPTQLITDKTSKVHPSVLETSELIFLIIQKNSKMPFRQIMQI